MREEVSIIRYKIYVIYVQHIRSDFFSVDKCSQHTKGWYRSGIAHSMGVLQIKTAICSICVWLVVPLFNYSNTRPTKEGKISRLMQYSQGLDLAIDLDTQMRPFLLTKGVSDGEKNSPIAAQVSAIKGRNRLSLLGPAQEKF